MDDSEPPAGDVTTRATEEWTDETTTFDRVRQVIELTTEPTGASDLADRAQVSEPTARKHLESLTASGHAKAVTTHNGTRYMRSPAGLAVRRIAAIHREYTKSELTAEIERLNAELRQIQDRHDVATRAQLLTDGDHLQDVRRWRELERRLSVTQAALTLYEFDPDDSRSAVARLGDSTVTDRGAFASVE